MYARPSDGQYWGITPITKRADITGAILAGGKSSRMRRDKALLELDGKTFIQRIAETLTELSGEVIIISNHGNRYGFLGLPIFRDIYKGCGPLGGIHSALVHARMEAVFITSCDVPFISVALIRYVTRCDIHDDVTLLCGGNSLQPLCGLYKKSGLTIIEKHLKIGQHSVLQCLRDMHTTILSPRLDGPLNVHHDLMNVNTPADYARCVQAAQDQHAIHPKPMQTK